MATVAVSPVPVASPSGGTSQPAQPTFAPAPSGLLAIPSDFAVELVPGRYWSSPPFEIGFSFQVDRPGWIAGHLNAEFFDIQRDADGAGPAFPESIVAFGLPTFIRGATDIPVADLTAARAVAELQARASLGASNVTELTLFGRPAVRVDLHSAVQSPVFGAAEGTFTISPPLDARLVLVPLGEGLLAVIVQAGPEDLEATWLEAVAMLESSELPG